MQISPWVTVGLILLAFLIALGLWYALQPKQPPGLGAGANPCVDLSDFLQRQSGPLVDDLNRQLAAYGRLQTGLLTSRAPLQVTQLTWLPETALCQAGPFQTEITLRANATIATSGVVLNLFAPENVNRVIMTATPTVTITVPPTLQAKVTGFRLDPSLRLQTPDNLAIAALINTVLPAVVTGVNEEIRKALQ